MRWIKEDNRCMIDVDREAAEAVVVEVVFLWVGVGRRELEEFWKWVHVAPAGAGARVEAGAGVHEIAGSDLNAFPIVMLLIERSHVGVSGYLVFVWYFLSYCLSPQEEGEYIKKRSNWCYWSYCMGRLRWHVWFLKEM